MERGEPALVPEWYKAANGGANPNHHAAGSSTHLEELGSGVSLRNRLPVSASDRSSPRSLAFADRSLSSSRGSPSTNGSVTRDKDSHPYSSFGRSRRDRERERERERDLDSRGRDRVRNRSSLVDNGLHDHSDSFKSSSKDRLRRSHSMVSGRQIESWTKRPWNDFRPGNNSRNVIVSGGGLISGIGKSSFERDFPTLGTEEKQRFPDRVSSPGINTAVQSLSIGSSAVIGGDGWTSALVEVPAPQTPSATAGLNMAEALVQAPSRVLTSQLSVDTRIEELTLRQCKQLIPVTPLMPKTLVHSSSDKLKSKGGRSDLSGPPKVGQQSSPQSVNHLLRAPRSDILKTSQAGNFQVLNRDRNAISPTAKDVPTVSRAVNPLSVVASAPVPLKGPLSPKLKADNKGPNLSSMQNCFGEKRPLSQAQNRNDFFNALRKKTSVNNSIAPCQPNCAASLYGSEKSGEQSSVTCDPVNMENNATASGSGLDCCSIDNGNGTSGDCDNCEGTGSFVSDNGENESCLEPVIGWNEKETAFLRSLGWEENAGEEALTAEEIDAFVKEYEKLKPSLKLFHRDTPNHRDTPKQGVSGTANSGSSGCKAEA